MEKLYHDTKGHLEMVHFALGRLERSVNEQEAQVIAQEIQVKLNEIDTKCDQLNIFVNKEPPNRRHLARQKVDQLKNDSQSINLAISTMYSRLTTKWKAASDREELLKQRFRTNESTALSMDDHEFQMNDRLQNSNRQIDDLLGHGLAVLDSLRTQHMSLRGVKRKMLDIGSALGLSSTTLNMIDRRVKEDWYIFVVGCIFVLVFMYVFYRFWSGW